MADSDRRQQLRQQYLKLGVGELVAAALFCVLAITTVQPRLEPGEAPALWGGLAPLVVVLLQGGAYWLLARSWVKVSPMPRSLAVTFSALRVANVALLLAGLAAVALWWPARAHIGVLAVIAWLFGVVEYVNYYVARLAYPLTQWLARVGEWRTPRLVQDLRSAQRGGAGGA
uniref:hypothetical protein n=1 Tax=Tessaracoccus timonensis TaxID=2161816 RepID=UPI000D54EF91|nr:hypothetical protein [Tessaracoccus timonensis]